MPILLKFPGNFPYWVDCAKWWSQEEGAVINSLVRNNPTFYVLGLIYTVMSTNIRIFKNSNKMALEYYLYSYSCHFPSTNIIRYSFVDFLTTEYIRIFVRKFSKIQLYLNICSEPYFNIQLSIFYEKSKSRYNLCIKNIQCKILFRGNISECF